MNFPACPDADEREESAGEERGHDLAELAAKKPACVAEEGHGDEDA